MVIIKLHFQVLHLLTTSGDLLIGIRRIAPKIAPPPPPPSVRVRVTFSVGRQFSSGKILLEPYQSIRRKNSLLY